jgi:hypothetical protein
MSLINDALRRKNQQKNPTSEKPDGSPMEPVQPAARNRVSFLAPILLLLIVLVLALAALFFWKGLEAKKELAAAKQQTPTAAATVPAETKEVQPVAPVVSETKTEPATAPQSVAETADTSVTNLSSTTNAAIAAGPPPGPEPLKLQGIFYRLSNPTALINGKTVAVGDQVSDARVIRIEREAVTLERDGKTEKLTLD